MRMSCNGCRVLRKGCTENCTIRPCLLWISSHDSQAHATVFLAKFYGRAALLNLINAGPSHLRPAIFRSLLYEACGRIVNPIYGSVGLLWSGQWQLCQNAVDSVLRGAPITPHATAHSPPGYDIRHVTKDDHKLLKPTRTRFKRSVKPKPSSSIITTSHDDSTVTHLDASVASPDMEGTDRHRGGNEELHLTLGLRF